MRCVLPVLRLPVLRHARLRASRLLPAVGIARLPAARLPAAGLRRPVRILWFLCGLLPVRVLGVLAARTLHTTVVAHQSLSRTRLVGLNLAGVADTPKHLPAP
ncbi:hypothetical protein GCM10028784_02600 [Myceligenerans cantabricum]